MRFGRGTVLSEAERNKAGRRVYVLLCECGNTYSTCMDNLKSGGTKSCGCLKVDTMKKFRHPNTMPYGVASFYNLLRHYKIEATKRGLAFTLTEEQFAQLTKQNCFYCGIEPSTVYKRNHGNGEYIYNGIDRIDNNLGYDIDNVVACCKICNMAKHTMSVPQFRDWIERVHNNFVNAIQDVR